MIILVLLASLMFLYVWINFVKVNNQTGHLMGLGNIGMTLIIYAALFIFFGHGLHAFKIGVERIATVLASISLTIAVTDFTEVFISMAVTGQFRFFFSFFWRYILLCLVQLVVLCILAYMMTKLYRRLFPPLQLLEICGEDSHGIENKLNTIIYKYHVAKSIRYDADYQIIKEEVPKYDAVLINDVPSHEKNMILKTCVEFDKRVYIVPKISDVIIRYSEQLNLIDTPLFLCRNSGLSFFERFIKRTFDILLSLLALIILSPILVITAIAIKAEDGGPVFFRQERCTINGNRFMILKFRSMIVDAEKDGRPHPAGEKDDRITKVGNVIRATRIDELPQLINILLGQMSIVGPRPERVEHVEKYKKDIPEFTFREKVKGGLTGYAQVYGKYNTTALDKLKLDLIYIMNYSLLLDLQIIFETVKILVQKESTEGFSEERVEEMHDYDN